MVSLSFSKAYTIAVSAVALWVVSFIAFTRHTVETSGALPSRRRDGWLDSRSSFAHLERASGPRPSKNLLIVASLSAGKERVGVTVSNLAHFSPQTWDCIILTHEPRSRLSDEMAVRLLQYGPRPNQSKCELYRWEGMHWVGLLKTIHPVMVESANYRSVALLLDDAILVPAKPQLESNMIDRIMSLARVNNLSVASVPLDSTATPYWPAMAPGWLGDPRKGRGQPRLRFAPPSTSDPLVGRLVEYVDILFAVFSAPAWRCFHSLLEPTLNTNGWGMDHLLHPICGARIGLLDEFRVRHLSGSQDKNNPERVASGHEHFPVVNGQRLDEEAQEEQLICSKLGCCTSAQNCVATLKRRHRSNNVVLGLLELPPPT